ncbi:DNA polymerase III subunit epsilon [Sphingomonas sp. CL5.1]|uniref:3'-5' exonuclease n=1 Tax=Sphingomonas sp. CL5.1 TaxID=2653203 RepID=UPI0015821E68|nr:3'-5' exonuclease [Sphingomonas sp. CL5.1]QKS00132.1 DNA polymerase III subunit epsilon [Sphingomonas sp. CL5.1]
MTYHDAADDGAAKRPPRADTVTQANDWDIRILRRVARLKDLPLEQDPVGPIRQVCVLDTETTGIDPDHDQVIDIAYVVLAVDALGEIVGIVRVGEALCDPGMPIPERISRLTGLTDADVAGKAIDLDVLEEALAPVDVFVAHNCAFDAAFLRHLLPMTADAAWACSAKDIDWLEHAGLDGRALGHLLMQIGFYNDAHRAMADAVSLIHLLSHRLANGSTVMSALLDTASQETIRIEATGAPFDRRGILKARGYSWDARAKVWWTEVSAGDLEAERLWLGREVVPWGPEPRTCAITWQQRHR